MAENEHAVARARTTDPPTSHMAAADAEADFAKDQRKLCLDQVRRTPGRTAAEIAVLLRVDRHMPSRRLPELCEDGLVMKGDKRECSVKGRSSLTWWPVYAESLFS